MRRRQNFQLTFENTIDPRRRVYLLFGVAVCLASLCTSVLWTDLHRIREQQTGDFEHFFYAADAMNHGTDPYAAHTRGYIYPPLIAFAFQLLTLLTRNQAAAVMLCINVAVTLLAVRLAVAEFLKRAHSPRDRLTTMTLMLPAMLLNIDKIKGEWQMWQTDVWMLLLFVVALQAIDRFPMTAGWALGAAINIKYIPLIFLPYLLVRRRWQAAVGLILGTIFFALLPAVSSGWAANCRNWSTAANGLLQMTEVHTTHSHAAEVHDVKDSLSCSITSAMARATGTHPLVGFALAGAIALLLFFIAWGMYHQYGIPLFRRTTIDKPLLTAVEWVMLIAVALAFAPQTNTRHLFDALIFTVGASVLLIFSKPATPRWPLAIGTTIMFLGFILPFGSRTFHGERNPTVLWLRMAGPCWCLMTGAMTLLWTGLNELSDTEQEVDPVTQ